jgi:hypothetical protein
MHGHTAKLVLIGVAVGLVLGQVLTKCSSSWISTQIVLVGDAMKNTTTIEAVTATATDTAAVERLTNCTAVAEPSPSNSTTDLKPIWIPAYPGSGSEMLRAIARHATGLGGDDVYFKIHCQGSIPCKTHWPSIAYNNDRLVPSKWIEHFADRYLLLVRNPAHALPSDFNYKWEARNKVRAHSVQAPEEEWVKWRDRSFAKEVGRWKSMFVLWRNETMYQRSAILVYEELTSLDTGPAVFGRVVREIERAGVVIDNPDCHWFSVVKKDTNKTKRAAHSYQPGYTVAQKQAFLRMLTELQEEFHDDAEVVRVVKLYFAKIQLDLRVVEEEEEKERTNTKVWIQMQPKDRKSQACWIDARNDRFIIVRLSTTGLSWPHWDYNEIMSRTLCVAFRIDSSGQPKPDL